MFNLTKLALLWDWVNLLKKDSADVHGDLVSLDTRVDALEVTAPRDYSTTETATGQKWIDGKDIYCKVYDNITVPSPASTQTIDDNFSCSDFIYGYCMFDTSDGKFVTYGGNGVFVHTNGSLRSYITSASYLGATGKIVVFYTKPDPTPGRAPEDPEETPEETKKTTKKKTSK